MQIQIWIKFLKPSWAGAGSSSLVQFFANFFGYPTRFPYAPNSLMHACMVSTYFGTKVEIVLFSLWIWIQIWPKRSGSSQIRLHNTPVELLLANLVGHLCFKGTVSRDFLSSFYSANNTPGSPGSQAECVLDMASYSWMIFDYKNSLRAMRHSAELRLRAVPHSAESTRIRRYLGEIEI
jgi:hypothetical protein